MREEDTRRIARSESARCSGGVEGRTGPGFGKGSGYMFGQLERKDRARLGGRRDTNRAAVRLDQLVSDVQAKADAARTVSLLLSSTGPAYEGIKNLRQFASRNGCSLVPYRDHDLGIF